MLLKFRIANKSRRESIGMIVHDGIYQVKHVSISNLIHIFCSSFLYQHFYFVLHVYIAFCLVKVIGFIVYINVRVCVHCISIFHLFYVSWLVLKRCISGLPKNECPFIPKRLLQHQTFSRNRRVRSITYNATDFPHDLVKRSPVRFPDTLPPLSQTAVNEPVVECEDRRQLGIQILKEKGESADSMLSRLVGNFIVMFSNQTTAQEVSGIQVHLEQGFCIVCFCCCYCWKNKMSVEIQCDSLVESKGSSCVFRLKLLYSSVSFIYVYIIPISQCINIIIAINFDANKSFLFYLLSCSTMCSKKYHKCDWSCKREWSWFDMELHRH